MYVAVLRWVDRWGIVFCVVLGIALRFLIVWLSSDQLTVDRDVYLGIARNIAHARGFCTPETSVPTAFRPPLYPLQLSALLIVSNEAVAVAILNLVWGAVAIWATCLAGESLGLGRLRIVAGLLVAVDPLLVEYSSQPMTETTCAGLVALLLLSIVWTAGREGVRQFTVGLLFGLLVLCRPTFWPFVGLLLMGRMISSITRCERPDVRLPFHRQIHWAILGTLLVVGPWVIRNAIVMNSPILTTTHGGYTLLLANNASFYDEVVDRGWGATWSIPGFDRWQSDLNTEMVSQLGHDATEMDCDRWQNQKARAFIASHTRQFLHAVGHRILSLWSPVPQGEAASRVRAGLILAVGSYYRLVLFAFFVGLATVAMGDRRRSWWPLYALVLTIQIAHLFYWTNARMRAPLVPVIALFAVAPWCRKPNAPASVARPDMAAESSHGSRVA